MAKLEVMKFFGLLDEINSDLKDDIENLINESDPEFMQEESLQNEPDSDDELLNLLVPEVLALSTIEKILGEGSGKHQKKVKEKDKEKGKGKEKGKEKGKDKEKSKEKKERK